MGSETVTFRLATPEDREAMAEVIAAANSASPHDFTTRVQDRFGVPRPGGRRPFAFDAVVADVGGRVVGFSGWRIDPKTGIGEVKGNYVLPEFQGRGISSRLVKEGGGRLRALGPNLLKVRTEEDNRAARHIYEDKFGYEVLVRGLQYARLAGGEAPPIPGGVSIRPGTEADRAAARALDLSRIERWKASEMPLVEERYAGGLPRPWRELRGDAYDARFALVAERGGAVAGLVSFIPGRGTGSGCVTGLAARETDESGDIGPAMAAAACAALARDGDRVVCAEILETDRPAVRALEAAGFGRLGAIVICYRRP